MLKRKAIRKILITTFTLFTLFVLYLIPTKLNDPDMLTLDYDVEYTSQIGTNAIYLLGPNNYLVKTNVLLDESSPEAKIKSILNYLTLNKTEKLPSGLRGIIPENTILKSLTIENKIATLEFSHSFFDVADNMEERLVEAVTYSLIDLNEVTGVTLKVEGVLVSELPKSKKKVPEVLTKDFGINKVYDIDHRNGIQKVTLYYLDKVSNNNYYVPVTKYVNDSRDKIKIIIDQLSSSYIYETNLMSYLNQDTELLDYQENDGIMVLDFNEAIFNNHDLLEEVLYSISYSVFDTYGVDTIELKVNGQEIEIFHEQ